MPNKKKKVAAKKKPVAAKKVSAPRRPKGVPAAAVWNAADNEWELGKRSGTRSVGEWTWWRPDGTVVCRSTYDAAGKLHGVARRHHPDGSTSLESRYVHGVRWGKTRHTRSPKGDSDEDVHMAQLPDHVFELAMTYHAGEVLLLSMMNSAGTKKPPKLRGVCFEDFAREIPKYEAGTAFMVLGTVVDIAKRRFDVPVLYYDGPAHADFSVLRFAFAPPGLRTSETPSWQDPDYGTAISLDEAKKKLVLAVDALDLLFSPGRTPPDAGFSIELEKGAFTIRNVAAGGLAAKAGLRVGDVIVTMNGKTVAHPSDYLGARGDFAKDRRLALGVKRGKQTVDVNLVAK